jgi:ornithine carbamoyltransferase
VTRINFKSFSLKSRHLTKDTDIDPSEIGKIFELTDIILKRHKKGTEAKFLPGKTLGMIFEKSSTRTRVSFQVGMYQLGGQALHLTGDNIQISRGESIEDTAEVLSRYLDAIMIRTFSQERIEELAKNSRVPVINGLSDSYHPCQALTDYYTIQKKKKGKAKLCYIGDAASNVAISLALTGAMLGHELTFCSPPAYRLPDKYLSLALDYCHKSKGSVTLERNPAKAVQGADFLYTDVWVSMGKESEIKKRQKDFKGYTIDLKLIDQAGTKPYILHCLPANWGQEIAAEVRDYRRNIIFEQAENRLHVQKAILLALMG